MPVGLGLPPCLARVSPCIPDSKLGPDFRKSSNFGQVGQVLCASVSLAIEWGESFCISLIL